MEQAAETYSHLDEGGLRQCLRLALEGNRPGSSSAEALNGAGKTDILVRYGNRIVLIVECKIWTGIHGALAALDQLLTYTTWRDQSIALMFFVRGQKIGQVRERLSSDLPGHPSFVNWLEPDETMHDLGAIVSGGSTEQTKNLSVLVAHLPRGKFPEQGPTPSPAVGHQPMPALSPQAVNSGSANHAPAGPDTHKTFRSRFGTVKLTGRELAVLQHPAVNRLRAQQRFGLASLTYPGLTHSRLEAAINGVLFASKIMDGLSAQRIVRGPLRSLNPEEKELVRLGSMLFGIAQTGAGNVVGRTLGLDVPLSRNLMKAFERSIWSGQSSVSLRRVIDSEYAHLSGIVSSDSSASQLVVDLLSQDLRRPHQKERFAVRLRLCAEIVRGEFGVCSMEQVASGTDGLGNLAMGFPLELLDRRCLCQVEGVTVPAFDLGNEGDRRDTFSMLELAIVNETAFRQALTRSIAQAAEGMLERAVCEIEFARLWGSTSLAVLEDDLVGCSDWQALELVRQSGDLQAPDFLKTTAAAASNQLQSIQNRLLHRRILEYEVPTAESNRARALTRIDELGASNRTRMLRRLEFELGLAPLSLCMGVPRWLFFEPGNGIYVRLGDQCFDLDSYLSTKTRKATRHWESLRRSLHTQRNTLRLFGTTEVVESVNRRQLLEHWQAAIHEWR